MSLSTLEEAKLAADLAEQVATYLPGFTYTRPSPPADGDFPVRQAYLHGANEAKLCLTLNSRTAPDALRVVISGSLRIGPRGEYIRTWPARDNPEISVAVARGPEVIAKEITRRVLPGYMQALALARVKRDEDVTYEENQTAVLQRLAAIVWPVRSDVEKITASNGRDRFHFHHGEVCANPASASLKLDSLTIPQAEAILSLLAELLARAEAEQLAEKATAAISSAVISAPPFAEAVEGICA
jgi:hypothetical protein